MHRIVLFGIFRCVSVRKVCTFICYHFLESLLKLAQILMKLSSSCDKVLIFPVTVAVSTVSSGECVLRLRQVLVTVTRETTSVRTFGCVDVAVSLGCVVVTRCHVAKAFFVSCVAFVFFVWIESSWIRTAEDACLKVGQCVFVEF